MATRYDTEQVRRAASGRWRELLPMLGGISADLLDGNHHPCPRCGGQDRFRIIDAKAGALLCNQCFSDKNGDGFAALQWLRDWTFPEAIKQVAEQVGVAPKGSRAPDKDLEFQAWNDRLAAMFCQKRKGCTPDGLKLVGAKVARYQGFTVFAMPVIGETLDQSKPVGWVVMNVTGGTLPKYDRHGTHIGDVKVKLTAGSKPGLVGVHAIERLPTEGLAETIWKVEGVTDLIALQSKVPEPMRDRHLVVTNANGAGEQPKWMAGLLSRSAPHVLHDADDPGEAGAKLWSKEIARHGVACRLVRLPFEVAKDHGPDVRDWLNEGNTYEDLLTLAQKADVVRPAAEGDADAEPETPIQEMILSRLGLDVIREEANGAVRVFSIELRKTSTFNQLSKLSKVELLQAAGPRVNQVVSAEPDMTHTFSMDAVREALAIIASSRRGKNDDRGVGVWRGVSPAGDPEDSLLLVNDTIASRWNGDRVLRKVTHPRVGGIVLDFGSGSPDWFEHETLEAYTSKAAESVEWRKAAIDEACTLFGQWNWRGEHDNELATALVMASWLQTTWAWRPLVVVTGESNCGKSTLFETLAGKQGSFGLFGPLALSGAKSSEAGIRQALSNSGLILLLDEFEKSKDRDAILQMLRTSSRGDMVVKGSASHKATTFRMQHIVWLAAIESGLKRQPDVNRFIQLELRKADAGKQGKLTAPDSHAARDLGLRLLASTLPVALEARSLAIELKATRVEGVDPRLVESYSVPAALLGLAYGEDPRSLLAGFLKSVSDQGQEPVEADHELLFGHLMESVIHCDHGVRKSVAKLYESWRLGGVEYQTNNGSLQQCGIDFRRIESDGLTDLNCLIVKADLAGRNVLGQTDWRGARIDQLLLRVSGAHRRQLRLGGSRQRCVVIPVPDNYDPDGL